MSADHAAPKRRWGIWSGLAVICSLPVAWGLSKIDPDLGGLIGLCVILAAVMVSVVGRNVAGTIGSVRHVRETRADAQRAGGTGSLLRGWGAAMRGGRESNSDSATAMLERVGSKDGALRASQVRHAQLRRRRFRTDVRIELVEGAELSYLARGPFQAPRLARIMRTALGARCVDEQATATASD